MTTSSRAQVILANPNPSLHVLLNSPHIANICLWKVLCTCKDLPCCLLHLLIVNSKIAFVHCICAALIQLSHHLTALHACTTDVSLKRS